MWETWRLGGPKRFKSFAAPHTCNVFDGKPAAAIIVAEIDTYITSKFDSHALLIHCRGL